MSEMNEIENKPIDGAGPGGGGGGPPNKKIVNPTEFKKQPHVNLEEKK